MCCPQKNPCKAHHRLFFHKTDLDRSFTAGESKCLLLVSIPQNVILKRGGTSVPCFYSQFSQEHKLLVGSPQLVSQLWTYCYFCFRLFSLFSSNILSAHVEKSLLSKAGSLQPILVPDVQMVIPLAGLILCSLKL